MIRVVLRHIDDLEGALIGDFAPSEIDGLIDQFRDRDLYINDHEQCKLFGGGDDPTQWVLTRETRQHAVLEILLED